MHANISDNLVHYDSPSLSLYYLKKLDNCTLINNNNSILINFNLNNSNLINYLNLINEINQINQENNQIRLIKRIV